LAVWHVYERYLFCLIVQIKVPCYSNPAAPDSNYNYTG
jgi:hypothetical protein